MNPTAIIINRNDNVAIALQDIKKGKDVILSDNRSFPALADISYCHKVLIADVNSGDDIIKYGEVIGQASKPLKRGEWIHTHNMKIREE